MKKVLTLALATAVLTGCWKDPDSPGTWLSQLNDSPFKRKEALVNLYRIHEMDKELSKDTGKTGRRYKKLLTKFRKQVGPALVKAFDKKINKRYSAPQAILEHLIMFKADNAAPLFLRIIQEYVNGDVEKYGEEDAQEGLVGKAVQGLAAMAKRKACPEEALSAIDSLISKICVKHAAGRALAESLDPHSFIRNAVVKAMPKFIKAFPTKRHIMGKTLSTVLDYGFDKGEIQDPMVNIFAGRSLGDVGDTRPRSIEALVKCLFRKGRGRAFHPYCTVALAKLPDGPDGEHPAVGALRLLFQGDPWTRVMADLKKHKKKTESEALKKQLEAGTAMPQCPSFIPPKYHYVCDIFWMSRIQKWEEKEPGVVELNSIITLREIGEYGPNGGVYKDMLALYGSKPLERKWFAPLEKKDRWLPGVQMQRMIIKGYGKDMNIRMEFLFAAGRTGAVTVVPALKQEFIRSLAWTEDPGSMVKAAEAISRSPYDETMVRTLITKIKTAQTWIGHAFKYRMFKHAGWGKAKKQCVEADAELNKQWTECMNGGNTDEKCFMKFRAKYWLPEIKKLVGYFKPNDVKDYLNPICAKDMPVRKEPACKQSLTAEDKRHGVPKCGEWGPCTAENFYTCLDGDQELRIQYAEEATRAATPKEAQLIMNLTPEDLLRPSTKKLKDLPVKVEGNEIKTSSYYDPSDSDLIKHPYSILPKDLMAARHRKAVETVSTRLCQIRRRIQVVNDCKYDIGCYISVLTGKKKYTLRDCAKKGHPVLPTKKADWRQKEKAALMLASLAKKNRRVDAVRALCAAYSDATVSVRKAILLALDRIADRRDADKPDMGKKLLDVIESETSRRVKGVWQINRDARSCVGRMKRRKPQT
ncbi:MAG: hypothetical protein J7M25_15900 [Deltaproteobacteria bacterium]|nr:hypothetical protein [Deltaproteobacteria bacterium]